MSWLATDVTWGGLVAVELGMFVVAGALQLAAHWVRNAR